MLQYESTGAEGPPTVGIWRSCIQCVSHENNHCQRENVGEHTGSDCHRKRYRPARIASTAYMTVCESAILGPVDSGGVVAEDARGGDTMGHRVRAHELRSSACIRTCCFTVLYVAYHRARPSRAINADPPKKGSCPRSPRPWTEDLSVAPPGGQRVALPCATVAPP